MALEVLQCLYDTNLLVDLGLFPSFLLHDFYIIGFTNRIDQNLNTIMMAQLLFFLFMANLSPARRKEHD